MLAALPQQLNHIIHGPTIYEASRFAGIILRPQTEELRQKNPEGEDLHCLNRMLLEDAYGVKLSGELEKVAAKLLAVNARPIDQYLVKTLPVTPEAQQMLAPLAQQLNHIIRGPAIYEASRFAGIIGKETEELLKTNPQGEDRHRLNRMLLEDAYPEELSGKQTGTLRQFGLFFQDCCDSWSGWLISIGNRIKWHPVAMCIGYAKPLVLPALRLFQKTVHGVTGLQPGERSGIGTTEPSDPELNRSDNTVDANQLFHDYVRRALLAKRFGRCVPVAFLYLLAAVICVRYFGFPYSPLRASSAVHVMDKVILGLCIFGWCLLAFYVVDAVRSSRVLLTHLGEGQTKWPERVTKVFKEKRKMSPEHLNGYLDVLFTAKHTREVYQLAFYPMLVLLLLIVSRVDLFDYWTWPPALILVFTLNGLMMLGCALMLRREAQRIRDAAVERLESLQVHFAEGKCSDFPSAVKYNESLKLTLEEIRNIHTGAYAPWPADLAIIATLIPTGGAGLIVLLQRLLH